MCYTELFEKRINGFLNFDEDFFFEALKIYLKRLKIALSQNESMEIPLNERVTDCLSQAVEIGV